jgi:nucleoid DNA-binding protein/regulator of protease activity HflC (stomatin/prohibitin superfamily)
MRKTNLIFVAIAAIFVLGSCTTVDSTSVGIKFHKWSASDEKQGGVIGTVRGWVWFNPFTQSVHQYPVYVQRVSYEEITVNTKDGAIFRVSPTLAYRLDADRAIDVFLTYRRPLRDIEQGFILTCVFEAYRIVGNTFTSDELMAQRGEFEGQVRERLELSLGTEGFNVVEFTAQIMPPQSLIASIDARNQMVQESLRAQNEVQRTAAQAEIAITRARGEAEALRIQADAEAYYNRTVAASLTSLLIQQELLNKWDGKLPVYTGGNYILPAMPITKSDLIDETAISCGVTRDFARISIEQFFDVVKDFIKVGNSLEIRGFGTFSPRTCNPRLGRNLKTGEPMPLAAGKSMNFKFSSELKAKITGSESKVKSIAGKRVRVRELEAKVNLQ